MRRSKPALGGSQDWAVTDGLDFVPYANGVPHDSEDQRRPLLHKLVGQAVLPAAYATDDGAGVLHRGTETQLPRTIRFHRPNTIADDLIAQLEGIA